ncbi:hypothetical protein ACHAXT_012702 [Thalassiosira profunda]
MGPSQKRSRAALAAAAPAAADGASEGAKLCQSLSRSLGALLTNAPNSGANASGDASGVEGSDVYRQFLNSPPRNASPAARFHSKAKRWMDEAAKTVGVGSNENIHKFWRERGTSDEESYADGRYLLWLVQLTMGPMGPDSGDEGGENDTFDGGEGKLGEAHLAALEAWHASMLELLQQRGAPPPKTNDDGLNIPVANDGEEEEEGDAGVMWQMLLQNARLSPPKLCEAWEGHTSSQEESGDDEALPSECFQWPSFFRAAVLQAEEERAKENEGGGSSNKRRKSNVGGGYVRSKPSLLIGGGMKKNTDWYPLLGYAVARAFLHSSFRSSGAGATVDQKMKYLKEHIAPSLPRALNIGQYDCDAKHALLAGVAACVVDEVGEWTVLDGLVLGELEEEKEAGRRGGGRDAEDEMNADVCERMRAEVGSIVDVLLVEGVLSRLGKLTSTPLPNLVAESADALLNYSEVHHRLRSQAERPASTAADGENGVDSSLAESLAEDARVIAKYIDKADPQLELQLLRRKFAPAPSHAAIAPGDPIPLHPMVASVRARLLAGDSTKDRTLGLSGVARTCKRLEDSTGVEEATKRHCWLLLFERMHDEGALFEDGWNDPGAGATLANVTLGHVGLRCALDYLNNVVLEAKEALLGGASGGLGVRLTTRRTVMRATEELLCVKDAVRRTVLKLLAPRAYSPDEALRMATELSEAGQPPKMDHTAWGNAKDGRAVDVACRILVAPTLYSVWNERLAEGEEEELEEEEVFQEALEEAPEVEGAKEQQGAQMGQPTAKAAEDEEDEVIDLEDSEDEAAVADAIAAAEEKDDITYPRHYHEYGGNYSESDDYEEEDEEEADRRAAFEGEYESDEGRGDSSGGEDGEDGQRHRMVIPDRQQGQEDLVELLDSSEEEAEEELEDEEELQREETEALNEKVDRYIAEHEDVTEGEGAVAAANSGAWTEQEEGRILSEAVDEYIVPSSVGKKAKEANADDSDATKELETVENEEEGETNLPYSYTDDLAMADDERDSIDTEDDKRSLQTGQGETFDDAEEIPSFEAPHPSGMAEDEQPSVLVRAAMSAAAPNRALANFSERDAEDVPTDNQSYDNTSAALESAADYANLWENYDDASQGDDVAGDGSNVQVVARYHGQDIDALAPVLDVHADADDDIGSDMRDNKVAQQSDDGYVPDAEATEEKHPNRKKEKSIDDGYMPDAEATEEEKLPKKEEQVAAKPVIDEGYLAEASEVEQLDEKSQSKRRAPGDVRFKADLETTMDVAPLPVDDHDAKSQSTIDEGYIPTDDGLTEEEKGRTRKPRPPPSIDEGYIPDGGHTTPGDATEQEDQGEEDGTLPKMAEEKAEAHDETKVPAEKRCDDTIDDGYLPSAVEGTEEERSEAEEEAKKDVAEKRAAEGKRDSMEVKESGILTSPNSGRKSKKEQREEAKKRNAQATLARLEEEKKARLSMSPPPVPVKDSQKDVAVAQEEATAKPAAELKEQPEEAAAIDEDFSKWSRDKLRAKLKELNLPPGKVKQDMVDILTNHFYRNKKEASVAEEPDAGDKGEGAKEEAESTKAASKTSRKRKAGRSAALLHALDEETPSATSTRSKKKAEATTTPSTMQSSRRSKRGRKPSPKKKASEQQDTPISELSHPVDSDAEEDQDESQEEPASAEASTRRSSRRRKEPSPGVPTSIVTKKRGKKPRAAERDQAPRLPVVPEGETVEGSTIAVGAKAEAKPEAKAEESSTKSKRSTRSTRQTKKDEAAEANNVASVASSTRRSTRGTPAEKATKSGEDEETTAASTRRSTRSMRSAATKKEEKPTPAAKRGRGRPKKTEAPKEEEKEEESVPKKSEEEKEEPAPVKKRGRGRPKKTEAPKEEETEEEKAEPSPVKKSGRGRPKKTEAPKETDAPEKAEEESVPSRRSARSVAKTKVVEAEEESVPSRRSTRRAAKKDAESVSVGTRRSTRSRAKK